MADNITITGLIATDPRHIVTGEGLPITTFRLASTQRRFDRANQKWIDADTNWYTISVFRQLAINAAGSLKKGERVVVTGRLRIREWQTAERNGMTVDVEADAVGHDLAWGSSVFARSIHTSADSSEPAPEATVGEVGADAGAHGDARVDVDAEPNGADDESRPMAGLPF
ncbi:MAG: single-stranded DNA-binding protein [Rhodoglobus sp.]|nr:single-stranded DNA-binding protein [Rhodoglobus sp.]